MRHLIVGDVHLTREGSRDVATDLAALIGRERGHAVVLAGDLVDLAAESAEAPAMDTIRGVFARYDSLRIALAAHVASGGELVLLAGNHDDELITPQGLQAFGSALGLDDADRRRVRSSPWFVRLGAGGEIHVEHGHHYDPDNALPHPLAPPDPAWHSLGIGLMHRFISPMRAGALVHANDRTPLEALRRAFEVFGPRAPKVIATYFAAAGMQLFRSGARYPLDRARASGDAALEAFAAEWGLPLEQVRAMVASGTVPTLASFRDTFLRLYWDRSLATAIGAVAATSALLGGPGRRVAYGAAAVLLASIVMGQNRYRGRVPNTMVEKAAWIREATGAHAVVFGHIHLPTGDGSYRNTGSFGFPGSAPGRPYVVVDESGAPEHGFYRA